MEEIEQRLKTLQSNLEAAQKAADPSAPYLTLLLQVKELAEIVRLLAIRQTP
jgi:hypothetical protein